MFLTLSAAVVVGCTSDGDGAAPSTTPRPAGRPDTTPPSSPPTSPPATEPTATTTTAATTTTTTTEPPPTTTPLADDPFRLGVSSGDPDERSVVLWTRLLGDQLPESVDVVWEVAADEAFTDVVARGTATATAADGHSVHVVAELDRPG